MFWSCKNILEDILLILDSIDVMFARQFYLNFNFLECLVGFDGQAFHPRTWRSRLMKKNFSGKPLC